MVLCQFERLSLRERLILIMDHASWIARDEERQVAYYRLKGFYVAVQLDRNGRGIREVNAFDHGLYYHGMVSLLLRDGLS